MFVGTGRVVLPALAAVLMTAASIAEAPPPPSDPAVLAQAATVFHDRASPVMGNPHGDVAVVEFFDYACSYCKAMQPRVKQLLESDHGVKLILKEFPILTPESMVAAKAALAAARQGKYAQFHDTLMAYRGQWDTAAIFTTAERVGLDLPRLHKDMASPAITDEILRNFNLARALRIFQTPGVIVGGHILVGPSAEFDFHKAAAAARAERTARRASSG